MPQITIVFTSGGFNRFLMEEIPRVGEEVAVVQGNGEEEVYRITKVRHRAYRSKINEYAHESAAMVWGELIDLKNLSPFTT